jgi:hypothetical protein
MSPKIITDLMKEIGQIARNKKLKLTRDLRVQSTQNKTIFLQELDKPLKAKSLSAAYVCKPTQVVVCVKRSVCNQLDLTICFNGFTSRGVKVHYEDAGDYVHIWLNQIWDAEGKVVV